MKDLSLTLSLAASQLFTAQNYKTLSSWGAIVGVCTSYVSHCAGHSSTCHPWVSEDLFSRESSRNILTKHLPDQILRLRRNRSENPKRKPKIRAKHRIEGFLHSLAIERRRTAEHYIQNDTGTPHIYLLIVLSPRQNLRRHIVRRSDDAVHHDSLSSAFEPFGGAEVAELKAVARVKEDVLRLDVAVCDEVAVAVRDGFDELGEDRGGVRLGEGFGGENAVVEGGFLAEIGDDEEMSIGIKQSVDLDDVRVRREKVEYLRFLDETVAVGRVVGEEAFVDNLHGVGGERRDGEAAVYDAETAATDLLAKLVLSLKTLAHYISLFLSVFFLSLGFVIVAVVVIVLVWRRGPEEN